MDLVTVYKTFDNLCKNKEAYNAPGLSGYVDKGRE